MLLHERLKNKRIILGSRSPRRRELLADCDITFEVADSYEVEEIFPADLPAAEVAEYLSRLKADGYPLPLAENDILITADTVVINNGEILGKPADRDQFFFSSADNSLKRPVFCNNLFHFGIQINMNSQLFHISL